MSILAEPRRKQRISVDPQNLQWGNDEGRVGKSMMEKMGWRGGGLGKMENGRRENLKLTANYTQKGLGTDKNTADANWIAHNDDFARILAELNQKKNKRNKIDEGEKIKSNKKSKKSAEDKVINSSNSLEERSQNSNSRRIRNHYRCKRTKHVKGYTAEQKVSIFGCANVANNAIEININDQQKSELAADEVVEEPKKKKKRKKNKKIQIDEEETEQSIDGDKMVIGNSGDNTRTVPMTMDQYFAQKMAEKSKKREIGIEDNNVGGDEEIEKKTKNKKKFIS